MRRLALRPASSFGARSSTLFGKKAATPMCLIFVVFHVPSSFTAVLTIWGAAIAHCGARSSVLGEKGAAPILCLIFVVINAPSSFTTVVAIWSVNESNPCAVKRCERLERLHHCSALNSTLRKRGSNINVPCLCWNPCPARLYDRRQHWSSAHC
jgi:hypothetical protein